MLEPLGCISVTKVSWERLCRLTSHLAVEYERPILFDVIVVSLQNLEREGRYLWHVWQRELLAAETAVLCRHHRGQSTDIGASKPRPSYSYIRTRGFLITVLSIDALHVALFRQIY